MNNHQPAALADGGQITEIAVITSGRIFEEFGRPLAAPFMAVVCGTAGCTRKPFALSTVADFKAMIAAYDPPAVTIIGATSEVDHVAELQKAVNTLMDIQSSGVKQ